MTDTVEHRIMIGDEQSFELLYRRYFIWLCAFANKFLIDPRVSEEVVQDIFLKLWENRATLRSVESGKSYLFMAVRNKCMILLTHLNVVNRYSEMIRTVYAQPEEFDIHESLMVKELNSDIRTIISDLVPEFKKNINNF